MNTKMRYDKLPLSDFSRLYKNLALNVSRLGEGEKLGFGVWWISVVVFY